VTVVPDKSSTSVFIKAISHGSNVFIPSGGQVPSATTQNPSSIPTGNKLAEKYEKKKAKKNITSDRIKSDIPILKPFLTVSEWCFPTKPSLTISLHQLHKQNITAIRPSIAIALPPGFSCSAITPPIVSTSKKKDVRIGHGLISTRW
jgi:hypothetical protein